MAETRGADNSQLRAEALKRFYDEEYPKTSTWRVIFTFTRYSTQATNAAEKRMGPTDEALAVAGTDAGRARDTLAESIGAYADRMGLKGDKRDEFINRHRSTGEQRPVAERLTEWNAKLDMADRYRSEFERRYGGATPPLSSAEVQAEWDRQAALPDSVVSKISRGNATPSEMLQNTISFRAIENEQINTNASFTRNTSEAHSREQEAAQLQATSRMQNMLRGSNLSGLRSVQPEQVIAATAAEPMTVTQAAGNVRLAAANTNIDAATTGAPNAPQNGLSNTPQGRT
jgi:hypothetical protein